MRVAAAVCREQSFYFSRKPGDIYDKFATRKAIFGKLSQTIEDSVTHRA
jgi:hypothetical protein